MLLPALVHIHREGRAQSPRGKFPHCPLLACGTAWAGLLQSFRHSVSIYKIGIGCWFLSHRVVSIKQNNTCKMFKQTLPLNSLLPCSLPLITSKTLNQPLCIFLSSQSQQRIRWDCKIPYNENNSRRGEGEGKIQCPPRKRRTLQKDTHVPRVTHTTSWGSVRI